MRVPSLVGGEHSGDEPVDAFAGARGDHDQRRPLQLRQRFVELLAELLDGAAAIFDEIPFVDGEDDRAALDLDQVGDGEVPASRRAASRR